MTPFVRNLIIGGALLLVEAIAVASGERPKMINGLPDLRKLKSREERRAAIEAYKATLRSGANNPCSDFWPEGARRYIDELRASSRAHEKRTALRVVQAALRESEA